MKAASLLLLGSVLTATAHPDMGVLPINPELGVPGFPNCRRLHPDVPMSVADAAQDLICTQKPAPAEAIKIGCIGDSITAGVHSSGGIHPYPQQLQLLLDAAHGNGSSWEVPLWEVPLRSGRRLQIARNCMCPPHVHAHLRRTTDVEQLLLAGWQAPTQ